MSSVPSYTQSSEPLSIRLCALSDAGGQDLNEDACEAVKLPRSSVLIVADGVGGHARGEVASQLVVQAAQSVIRSEATRLDPPELLRAAMNASQEALRDEISKSPHARTMRSTILIVFGNKENVWIGHVGDCRAYLIRGGKATQLTRDDTIVQTLLDLGQIDAAGAKKHSKANVLLQSIGDPKDLEYHLSDPVPVQENDVLVACSDGLSDVLDPDEIAGLVSGGASEEIAKRLVAAALERKAPDNVSVGVIVWRKSRKRLSIAARNHSKRKRARSGPDIFRVSLLFAAALLATLLAMGVWRRLHQPRHGGPVIHLLGR